MLNCPVCASKQTTVLDSRPVEVSIRRRRKCQKCDYRWTTFEVSVDAYNALTEIDRVLDTARESMHAQTVILENLRLDGRLIRTDAGIKSHRQRRVGSAASPGHKVGSRPC